MKKIFIIVLASAALILSTTSCKDEFLVEHPVDEMYANNLLVNYSGFYSMISAQRGLMRKEHVRPGSSSLSTHSAFNATTDLYFGNQRSENGRWYNWPNYLKMDTAASFIRVMFSDLYTIINVSNMIINRAENDDSVDWEGGSPEANEANKTSIIAQAKFFRAWAYRHLSYEWGDVPLSLEEVTGANYRTDWDRTPLAEVRAAIIADLEYCVAHLDWRTDGNNTKPNKAIAATYLGEMYMATKQNDKAVAILKEVCEKAPYHLMTERFGVNAANPGNPYIDNFRSPLYSEGNYEVLYSFLNAESDSYPYGSTDDSRARAMWKNYYYNLSVVPATLCPGYSSNAQIFYTLNGGYGNARIVPCCGALMLYDYDGQMKNDIRFDEYSMMQHIYYLDANGKKFEIFNQDGSLPIAIVTTTAMFSNSEGTIKNYFLPSTTKYDYVHSNVEKADASGDYQNIAYMRLAEPYLLYAEALYRTGNSGEAAIWINKIRSRAGVSMIDASVIDEDFILDERARELMCEGQRRHTLIRFSQLNEACNGDERALDNFFKRRVRELNEVCGQSEGEIKIANYSSGSTMSKSTRVDKAITCVSHG
jgi:SusD family.